MSGPSHQHPESGGDKVPRIGYLESIRGLAAVQDLLLHFLGAFATDLVT